MVMLTKFRHVDWGLVLVLAFVCGVAIAVLQLVNEIGDAERGLILYEKTCPLNAAPSVAPVSATVSNKTLEELGTTVRVIGDRFTMPRARASEACAPRPRLLCAAHRAPPMVPEG
jgi:hypothetical protein